jgi:hypothetical protein
MESLRKRSSGGTGGLVCHFVPELVQPLFERPGRSPTDFVAEACRIANDVLRILGGERSLFNLQATCGDGRASEQSGHLSQFDPLAGGNVDRSGDL